MKLLLMADGSVGREIFTWILQTFPEDIAAVVATAENNIFDLAKSASVPVSVYDNSAQVCDWLEAHQIKPDMGLLAWWPQIVRPTLLKALRHGFVNTHPSLLPFNRGKHYNFWAIVEQAPFGVTLHVVDDGVDTGPIIAQREIECSWEDTGETLYRKALAEMVELVKAVYPDLRELRFSATPQDLSAGSFHRSSEIDQFCQLDLDATYTARNLLNLLRARTFRGHPACCFQDENGRFEVRVEITKVRR